MACREYCIRGTILASERLTEQGRRQGSGFVQSSAIVLKNQQDRSLDEDDHLVPALWLYKHKTTRQQ